MATKTNAELIAENGVISEQNVKTSVVLDASFRRRGELRIALEELIEAVQKGSYESQLANAIAVNDGGQPDDSRYNIITSLVDSAIALADGDETVMPNLLKDAVRIRDFTANVCKAGRTVGVAPGKRVATAAKCTEAEAHAAIKQVHDTLGHSPRMAEFDAKHGELTARDLLKACNTGKWSDVQRGANIPVTTRGRSKAA